MEQEVGTGKRTGEVIHRPTTECGDGSVSMTPDPGWDYNPGVPGSREIDIRRMERRLAEAQQAGHEASAVETTRRSVAAGVMSKPFRDFIAHTKKEEGIKWPVAVMSSGRARELGFGDGPRVVRLSSESVDHRGHRSRWLKPGGANWPHIQEIVDEGILLDSTEKQRVLVSMDGVEKPYRLIVKETGLGEIFLVTYHRTTEEKKKKLREKYRK